MFKSPSKSKYEKGQGLVEYALILVLVAIVVIVALTALGPIVGNVFSDINGSLGGLSSGGGGGGGGGAGAVIAPTAVPTASLGICYLRWTGTQWVHWYDNTPEYPGPCP